MSIMYVLCVLIGDNPQYCLVADCLGLNTARSHTGGAAKGEGEILPGTSSTQTIWVLLSRHYSDRTAKTRGHGTHAITYIHTYITNYILQYVYIYS